MTVAQMAKMIGTLWMLSDGKGLSFTVRVEDMQMGGWNTPRCLVSPVDGSGERWVNLTSLSAIPAPKA
jgi:hypothetical protein